MKYKLLKDSKIKPEVKAGDTVYTCHMSDYGCARDNTIETGILHISVTLDKDGQYPFFTVPSQDLEVIDDTPT